ncbi:MAG: hypothetical protein JNM62_01020 [Flavobacteriales bacterium]|nr:hypothetical protein [Flavobacteriales bacterium]
MRITIARSFFLLATVFTLGHTNAAEPVRSTLSKRSALERSLDRALSNTLSFPLMEKTNMTGQVHLSFVIDTEGRIQVIECNSANAELKAYVLRKLARIDVGENPGGSWKTTHMVFNFHPEKA